MCLTDSGSNNAKTHANTPSTIGSNTFKKKKKNSTELVINAHSTRSQQVLFALVRTASYLFVSLRTVSCSNGFRMRIEFGTISIPGSVRLRYHYTSKNFLQQHSKKRGGARGWTANAFDTIIRKSNLLMRHLTGIQVLQLSLHTCSGKCCLAWNAIATALSTPQQNP